MSSEESTVGNRPDAGAHPHISSGVGTILFHVLDDEASERLLEAALSLARSCSAHLTCVHVTPIEAYVAFSRFGGAFVFNDVMRKLDERNAALKLEYERRLSREDVSWDYEDLVENVAGALLSRAALADLIVVSRDPPRHDYVGPSIGFLGDLLARSRTPIVIPGDDDSVPIDLAGPVLVAWDGSAEAANAVRAGLGLLRMSSDVRLLTVEEKPGHRAKDFPPTTALEYLSRHGIHGTLEIEKAELGDDGAEAVSRAIVAKAMTAGASHILMGGYTHSRVAEYLFGGVTRSLLKGCPLSLVIAH